MVILKTELGILYQGDALEILRKVPNNSVDLVLTDPPYGLENVSVIKRNGGKFGKAKAIGANLDKQVISGVVYKDWIPLAYEKLKPVGVLITFCQKMDISDIAKFLEKELGMVVRHIGVWHKTNPPPQARKVQWMNAWEPFIIATKNKGSGHHYNYKEGQFGDVISTPICMGNERTQHPAQKPLKLFHPLVRWWSFEGDVVLDPFLGSGTTAVICEKLKRKWIGIEINEKYCKISKERILNEAKQLKLF